jgi:hypothetical protein
MLRFIQILAVCIVMCGSGCLKSTFIHKISIAPGTDLFVTLQWSIETINVDGSLGRVELSKSDAKAIIQDGSLFIRKSSESKWACYSSLVRSYRIDLLDDLTVLRDSKKADPDKYVVAPGKD